MRDNHQGDHVGQPRRPSFPLTPRQSDVLHRLLQGDSEKQAAKHLGISTHTVRDHIKALHRIHNASSRGELLSCYISVEPEKSADSKTSVGQEVEQMRVKVLVADRIEGLGLFQLAAAARSVSSKRSAAAGGLAAIAVVFGLFVLPGFGRIQDDAAARQDSNEAESPAQVDAEEAARHARWEAGKERGLIDFDDNGFPIQLAPKVSLPLLSGGWTGAQQVYIGRTYKLTSTERVEVTVDGGSAAQFEGIFYYEANAAGILFVRGLGDEAGSITVEDLGATGRLSEEVRQAARKSNRLQMQHRER
jgi:DNA-binding CsgD family transcriptional regulator